MEQLDCNPCLPLNATYLHTNVGFFPSPKTRGTIDLVQNCVLTILLCTWSIQTNRLQDARESWLSYFFRVKLWLFLLTLLVPELLSAIAVIQYIRSRIEVASFHEAGYYRWTTTHSLFSKSKGFVLKHAEGQDWASGALILELLKLEKIQPLEETEQDLEEQSRLDTTAKVLTGCQVGWFLLQCIARYAQRLPFSLFELTTLSFIGCAVMVAFCWRRKPKHIPSPIVIDAPDVTVPMLQTLDSAYERFPSLSNWCGSYMKSVSLEAGLAKPTGKLPFLKRPSAWIAVALSALYVVVGLWHILAWNFHFPTPVARWIWRGANLALLSLPVAFRLVHNYAQLQYDVSRVWQIRQDLDWSRLGALGFTVGSFFVSTATSIIGLNRYPARVLRDLEATEAECRRFKRILSVGYCTLIAIYVVARLYVIVEVFLSLRSVPVGVFYIPNWSRYIPHF